MPRIISLKPAKHYKVTNPTLERFWDLPKVSLGKWWGGIWVLLCLATQQVKTPELLTSPATQAPEFWKSEQL